MSNSYVNPLLSKMTYNCFAHDVNLTSDYSLLADTLLLFLKSESWEIARRDETSFAQNDKGLDLV